MTRADHLAWAKARALQYLPASPTEACTSMASDLTKHEETRQSADVFGMLYMAHAMAGLLSTTVARSLIEGVM